MEAGAIVLDNKPGAVMKPNVSKNEGEQNTQQSMIMIEQQEDGGKLESDGDNFKLPTDTDIMPDNSDQIKAPGDNEISAAAVDHNNPSEGRTE